MKKLVRRYFLCISPELKCAGRVEEAFSRRREVGRRQLSGCSVGDEDKDDEVVVWGATKQRDGNNELDGSSVKQRRG